MWVCERLERDRWNHGVVQTEASSRQMLQEDDGLIGNVHYRQSITLHCTPFQESETESTYS